MEMFCPECMGPLVSSDGQTAVCAIHGGTYRILFARHPLAAPAAATPQTGDVPLAAPLSAADGSSLAATRCAKHPEVGAVAVCLTCRTPVCQTCDFVFPGGVHLCPACAANPRPQLSPGRRKLIPWSIGLAIFSFLALAGMFVLIVNSKRGDAEAIGSIGGYLSFLPAVIGLALGVACFERRLKTPGVVWVGVIGNGLIVAIFLLLMVIGLMRQA